VLLAFLELDGVRLMPIATDNRKAILQTLTVRMNTPYAQNGTACVLRIQPMV